MRVSLTVLVSIVGYSGVPSWNMISVSCSKVKVSDTMQVHDRSLSVSLPGPFRKCPIPVQPKVANTTDEQPMIALAQGRKPKDAAFSSDSEFTIKRQSWVHLIDTVLYIVWYTRSTFYICNNVAVIVASAVSKMCQKY